MANRDCFEITGRLNPSDAFGRLNLVLVDYLHTTQTPDYTWIMLQRRMPKRDPAYCVPYRIAADGEYDRDECVRGECWITLDKFRRNERLELAAEFCGKEVKIVVATKPYRIDNRRGVSLKYVAGPEPLRHN